jgi:hypothetical protein
MTEQHTPGPWTADVVRFNSYTLRIIKAGTDWIAHVHTQSTESDIPRDVSNARLIAAAPELLEALEGYISDCTNDECERCIKARSVIAKARGTQ